MADVVAQVELPQSAFRYLDAKVELKLNATLLQAQPSPAHHHVAIQQVLGSPLGYLQTAVISAVEGTAVNHGLAHLAEAVEGVVCRVACAVQDRGDPREGEASVGVHLEDTFGLLDGHLVPNRDFMRHFFPPDLLRPRSRHELLPEVFKLIAAGLCEEILVLPLFLYQCI
jgi:hypothetical protein